MRTASGCTSIRLSACSESLWTSRTSRAAPRVYADLHETGCQSHVLRFALRAAIQSQRDGASDQASQRRSCCCSDRQKVPPRFFEQLGGPRERETRWSSTRRRERASYRRSEQSRRRSDEGCWNWTSTDQGGEAGARRWRSSNSSERPRRRTGGGMGRHPELPRTGAGGPR